MPQTLSQIVAAEIRAEMGRQKLTGAELARELGVSAAWVSYRINGHQEIGLTELERISAVLRVQTIDLIPASALRAAA